MQTLKWNNKLQHPFNLVCSCQSQGGKTFWIRRLLKLRHIEPFPKKIFYIYSYMSPVFKEMQKETPGLTFIQNIPDNIADETFADSKNPVLIILDDQMQNMNNAVVSLFTRGTHHLNRSVIMTVQNIFYQNPCMRTISLNCHYLVIWKQPRDVLQIEHLGRQMYPGQKKFFMEAYKKATDMPYGYLFLDLKSTTKDILRIRSCVLCECVDGYQRIYFIDGQKMEEYALVPINDLSSLVKKKSRLKAVPKKRKKSPSRLPRPTKKKPPYELGV